AVAHKNAAMKLMQRSANNLAEMIRAKPAVTDAQLISLGLLRRPQRTRRNAPDTPPIVRVLSVFGRVVNIRVCGRDSTLGRSKPFAARGAEILSYVGEQSPSDPSAYHFECFASRTTAQITF